MPSKNFAGFNQRVNTMHTPNAAQVLLQLRDTENEDEFV